jgi:hypothetical protein
MPKNPLIFWAWFVCLGVGLTIAVINQFHMVDEHQHWTKWLALVLTGTAVLIAFSGRDRA